MKDRSVLFLGFVLLVGVAILFESPSTPAVPVPRRVAVKWEYKAVDITELMPEEKGEVTVQQALNKLGKEGWELVCVPYSTFYFKRRSGISVEQSVPPARPRE